MVGPVGGGRRERAAKTVRSAIRACGASLDQGDGLLDPPLLEPRRDPDIVMAGVDDDERGRERAKVNPRDLGGDRPLRANPGSHVARTGIPVYDGVPVQ